MEIYAETISEAWEESIKALLLDPSPLIYTQRGSRAKEILGLQMIIKHPKLEPMISGYYLFGDIFIEDYCDNILRASSGEHSINSRLVKIKHVGEKTNNQIIKTVNLLKKEPDSRRALICLWDAEKDMNSQHPPCVCIIQFMLRGNELETIAYFRSNDSWMAALPDMIAIAKLSDIISRKLKVKVGKYIHFAASYHLYEPDIVPAKYILVGVQ